MCFLSVTAVSVHAEGGARNTLFTVEDKPCLCHIKSSKIYSISQVRKKKNTRTSKAKRYEARSTASLVILHTAVKLSRGIRKIVILQSFVINTHTRLLTIAKCRLNTDLV